MKVFSSTLLERISESWEKFIFLYVSIIFNRFGMNYIWFCLENNYFIHLILKTSDGEIGCHKSVLFSRSLYLSNLYNIPEFENDDCTPVIFDNYNIATLELVVKFLYWYQIEKSKLSEQKILKCWFFLQITQLPSDLSNKIISTQLNFFEEDEEREYSESHKDENKNGIKKNIPNIKVLDLQDWQNI